MSNYLMVIGEQKALAWVLRESAMAFEESRKAEVGRLEPGDRLLIYTSGRCFHNQREPGRVIGEARVASHVRPREEPFVLGARVFSLGCNLEILSLAPLRQGVALPPLIPQLSTFRDSPNWKLRLWRPIAPIEPEDAALLLELLEPATRPLPEAMQTYFDAAGQAASRAASR